MKLLPLAFTLVAACGNYSNEDIEFQLALPEKSDLETRLPGQAVIVDDAAEYHRTTRGLVALVGGIKDASLAIIDHVRLHPASSRGPNFRMWGPFPHEKQRDWQVRILMRKLIDDGTPVRFEYSLDLRRREAGEDAWIRLLWGHYLPGGGPQRSKGEVHIDTVAARAAGHRIDDPADPDDLNDLETLGIIYETRGFPSVIDMTVTNLEAPGKKAGTTTFSYREEADGQGSMKFSYLADYAPWIEQIELHSRWLATGAGRGDARVVKGLLSGPAGTDCWGSDSRPTFVRRTIADVQQPNRGDPAMCVFAEP